MIPEHEHKPLAPHLGYMMATLSGDLQVATSGAAIKYSTATTGGVTGTSAGVDMRPDSARVAPVVLI